MSSSQGGPADRPRLRIGVIGVGRVGLPLAVALANAGHPVVAAHAVSELSRGRVARHLPMATVMSAESVAAASDLLLIAVPDDALKPLLAGLAGRGALRPGQIVVHTSGRHGLAVLEPASRMGALPIALHPVMTFTGSPVDLDRLHGCPFGITAPEQLRAVAQALVVEMGGEPFWISESARPMYHAALANGSNHLVTLIALTLDLLQGVGVTDAAALIGPLLRASVDNVLMRGDLALTGPVMRGDAGTVAAHLEVLEQAAPGARVAYLAMARLTADRALAAGLLDPAAAGDLLEVLR